MMDDDQGADMNDVRVVVAGAPTSAVVPAKERTLNGPNPEGSAGILSKGLFLWVNPLFSYAKFKSTQNGEIEQADLWDLAAQDKSENIAKAFDAGWDRAAQDLVRSHTVVPADVNDSTDQPVTEKEAYHMLKSGLWEVGGRRMKISACFLLLSSCFMFTYPVLLASIVDYIEEVDTREVSDGYMYALAIFVAMLCRTVANNLYFFHQTRASYSMRSCVTSAVYRKSLRLSSSSRQGKTIGEIVNIMQVSSLVQPIYIYICL
jgi:hypothetical protein